MRFGTARTMGDGGAIAALVAGLVLVIGASSCGGGANDATASATSDVPTTSVDHEDGTVVSTTEPATASSRSMADETDERPAYVMRGNLFVTGDTASLCLGAAESAPPTCGGAILATFLVKDVVQLAPELADPQR